MWDKCTSVCRILLLAIVVMFAVYFIYTNEKQKDKGKGVQENFAVNVEQEYRKMIVYVFNMLLARDPEEFEILKYRDYMSNPYDVENMMNMIKDTQEYKIYITNVKFTSTKESKDVQTNRSTFHTQYEAEDKATSSISTTSKKEITTTLGIDDVKSDKGLTKLVSTVEPNERMNTYRVVMQVYERNLDRLPNMKELNYYTYRLSTDKDFTIEKLEKIIQSSKEFDILSKNQKNVVQTELPGNVTDAQVTFEVRRIYNEIIGGVPDKEFEEFLKAKFTQQYQLNEEKLKNLLLLIKAMDDNNTKIVIEGTDSIRVGKKQRKPNGMVSEETTSFWSDTSTSLNKKQEIQKVDLRVLQEYDDPYRQVINNIISSKQTLEESINPYEQDFQKIIKSVDESPMSKAACQLGRQILEKKTCTTPYAQGAYRDAFYENMENHDIRGSICSNTVKRDLLSDYTRDRNMDELQYSCSRNAYFLNLDDSIGYTEPRVIKEKIKDINEVLPSNFDKGHMPKVGTSIPEAMNTKVGSIMPKFVYKEYV